jgi:hypothetical protein
MKQDDITFEKTGQVFEKPVGSKYSIDEKVA